MEVHGPESSKYRNVLIAARRARQLQAGAEPTISSRSQKACRVAQDEVKAGKVTAESVGYRQAQQQSADAPPPATQDEDKEA